MSTKNNSESYNFSNKAFNLEDESQINYDMECVSNSVDISHRLDAGFSAVPYYREKNKYKKALKQLKLVRPIGKKDPKEFPPSNCGLLAFITASWLTSVLWTIYKKGIDAIEPWYLGRQDCSEENSKRLERLWEEEVRIKGVQEASLANVIFKFVRTRAIVNIICLAFALLALFIGPAIILNYLVEYKKRTDAHLGEGLALIAILFCSELIKAWLNTLCWNIGGVTGMRLRGAIICWLLKKILKVRSLGDKSVGQVVNICVNDGTAIFEAVVVGVYVAAAPIAGIYALGFTYNLIKYWTLLGITIFLLVLPLQNVIGKATAYFRRKGMQLTDQRVTMMNEVLTHIKLIKMYSWETSMASSLMDIRKKEARVMFFTNLIQSISMALLPFMAIISSAAALLAFLLFENELTSAQAFVVTTVYGSTRMSLSILPTAIRGIAEIKVASKRFANIIKREEIEKPISKPNSLFAVNLKNANFAWEIGSDEKEGELNEVSVEKLKSKTPPSTPNQTRRKSNSSSHNAIGSYFTLQDINLQIKKGKIIGICGSVGSGKSSLLSGLLGELKLNSGFLEISGTIAYVPQQAWLFNDSLRENILFGKDYDAVKYKQAAHAAGLLPDFELLAHGDQTEIVERGANLSGGQKQRVSLARAFYSDKDIYLLDDPLSAVDTRVGKHIFFEGLLKHLKGKTVILITHQLQFLKYCDYVYYMKYGRIHEEGEHSTLMANKMEYCTLYQSHQLKETNDDDQVNESTTSLPSDAALAEGLPLADADKLVQAENKAAGRVTWSNYVSYGKAVGKLALCASLLSYLLFGGCGAFNNLWLSMLVRQLELTLSLNRITSTTGYINSTMATEINLQTTTEIDETYSSSSLWNSTIIPTDIYDSSTESENVTTTLLPTIFNTTSILFAWLHRDIQDGSTSTTGNQTEWRIYHDATARLYIIVYSASILFTFVVGLFKCLFVSISAYQASTSFHDKMFRRVIQSPMVFYDSNPVGRIINRFSKDIEEVDTRLPILLDFFLHGLMNCIYPLVLIAYTFPYFLLAIPPLFIIAMFLDKIFQVGIRDTKRLENVNRSPVVSNLTTTIEGLSSIRCYEKEDIVLNRFHKDVDKNSVSLVMFNFEMRWLALRLEAISIIIVIITGFIVVFLKNIDSADTGLALSSALQINVLFQFTVRLKAETEARFTSVERLQEYITTLVSEPPSIIDNNRPPASWPSVGKIEFKNVEMRYRDSLPLVLKKINFTINPGEKIGIVGRTGSGKSSLAVALFRLAEICGGSIIIDGIDIHKIGLHDLRARLSVIPQDPVLFTGSIRYNLDPFNEYTDEQLWIALEDAHLRDHIELELDQLESNVETGGGNFSVGQRQLICLARALLRNSKILVMDEATASVDTETDAIIQRTIRERFSDYTLLIIAHRLNTVLFCDKILVMDAGQIVEFGTPEMLQQSETSIFKAMLTGSSHVEKNISPPPPTMIKKKVSSTIKVPHFLDERSISLVSNASDIVYHL